jgi:DNA-binding GntR family transcriptional regulator/DNA-binding LacI/PurR family transcriptional regulator
MNETSAAMRAYAFIKKAIEDKVFLPGAALPSLSKLASLAGVSRVSAVKAIKKLKEEKVLGGQERQRTVVLGDEEASKAKTAESLRAAAEEAEDSIPWQRISNRIREDVFNGTFSFGAPLPGYKELERRYGACSRTVKKSLEKLKADGLVDPYGRGWRITRAAAPKSFSRLTAIICKFTKGGFITAGEMMGQIITQIERECSSAGIEFQLLGYKYPKNVEKIDFVAYETDESIVFKDAPENMGYIYIVNGNIGQDKIIRMLLHTGKPVVVVDSVGGWSLSEEKDILKNPRFLFFGNCVAKEPACHVARYLLETGHRTIAYITPYRHYDWSSKRQKGLEETFAAAGFPNAVRAFELEPVELSMLKPVDTGLVKTASDTFAQSMDTVAPPARRAIHNRTTVTLEALYADIQRIHASDPVLSEILKHKDITAWVAANDITASIALQSLRNKGVRVPAEIGLVGFDNSSRALEQRITSYDFNIRGIIQAAFGFILGQSPAEARKMARGMRIEGIVIERTSSRR